MLPFWAALSSLACSRALIFNVGRDVEYDLRNDLFAHLQKLGLRFYDKNPIGRLITQGNGTLVIGVVGNVRHGSLEEGGRNEMYLNYHQSDDWSGMEMVVRSARPPEALVRDVRAALASYDPQRAAAGWPLTH
jgi:ABC-type multidrug transport system fused ATPase/permease subunit